MRIIFFGSDPWFSPPVLEAVLKAGHEVPIVITKGDAICKGLRTKDEGRRKIQIIQTKESKDISLNYLMSAFSLQPSAFSLTRPDAVVLAAFGPPFLPAEVLRWPKYGCLNVHASLLPRWRGASPVFGAIANGDKKTGVSIMRMTKEIDLGPILGQVGLKVSDNDNRETLTRRLGKLGGKLIVETLKKLQNGQINEVKQPLKSPTLYTHRLTKDSGRINWDLLPGETDLERSRRIERFIRAVTPWPGAQTRAKFEIRPPAWTSSMRSRAGNSKFEIKELKILKAHLEPIQYSLPAAATPQALQAGVFSIQYSLVIDLVQLPGKNPISWKAFLAGHPGAKLE